MIWTPEKLNNILVGYFKMLTSHCNASKSKLITTFDHSIVGPCVQKLKSKFPKKTKVGALQIMLSFNTACVLHIIVENESSQLRGNKKE